MGTLVGAALMVVFSMFSLDKTFSAIDMHTLLLLLGMTIITVYSRIAGFFELMADKSLSFSEFSIQFLIFIISLLGLFSALFVNYTICLVCTPTILAITTQLKIKSMPYLLTLATFAKIRSVMTITGNPQNILIGSVANQQAKRTVDVKFMEYFRVGVLIAIITATIGILTLAAEVKCAHGKESCVAKKNASPTVVAITHGVHSSPREFRIVLLCNTNDARERGLQGFHMLKPDEAALFVYTKPESVTFWMGSVVYSIDIIFVGPDKKVQRVYPDCKPGSLELYPSLAPIQWVVETAAGSGVRVGDRVRLK